MPSLVSERFRIHSAKQFVESFSETANDQYYLFIARQTPWANGDSSVPTPEDSIACATFNYWQDMVAMVKIKPTDICHAVVKNSWAPGHYKMYDCDEGLASLYDPTDTPFYVTTTDNHIFKCIYNGSYGTVTSNSTSAPTITGQADITTLTVAAGDPNNYLWKFVYDIPTEDINKFAVGDYVPIRAADDFIDAIGGDITTNSLAPKNYEVFDIARLTNNGAIYQIAVTTTGAGYGNIPPLVDIQGDGTGATAVATVRFGSVTGITMTSYGKNYTYANVILTPRGATPTTTAVARAVINPRNSYTNTLGTYYRTNHGIDVEQELGAKYVIISVKLEGAGEDEKLPVNSEFRRVGILKNPVLYGSNTVASGNIYSQTLDLIITGADGNFNKNELVYQTATNAYGVVVEAQSNKLRLTNVRGTFTENQTIIGIGNGNTDGQLINTVTIPSQPEPFTVVPASGVSASVLEVEQPEIEPYSGDILYIDNRATISRQVNYAETVRVVLSF